MKYKTSDDVVMRKIAGEVLLVPVKGNLADMQQVFTLNETGEVIWSAVAAGADEECMVKRITDTFQVPEAVARADARELLDVLLKKGLIRQVA